MPEMQQSRLPSFSIVIETENLAKTAMSRFYQSLNSLVSQNVPITEANELILVESGDVSPDVLDRILTSYPWIIPYRLKPNTNYYKAKMEGAAQATGEIVVFCDSDCIYEANWLEQLLRSFDSNDLVKVVAGETAMAITGAFSLGIALLWGFPTFSHRKEIYEVSFYAANNVAFRRQFLTQLPIPCDDEYYRGNCSLHGTQIRQKGYKIWKQDSAITMHPLPAKSAWEFFWRFLVMGTDWLTWHRAAPTSEREGGSRAWWGQELRIFGRVILRWLFIPVVKLPPALRENPRRLLFVPLATPIVLSGVLFFFSGFFLGHFFPNSIRKHGVKYLEP